MGTPGTTAMTWACGVLGHIDEAANDISGCWRNHRRRVSGCRGRVLTPFIRWGEVGVRARKYGTRDRQERDVGLNGSRV